MNLQSKLAHYSAYFEAMLWADVDGSDNIQGDYTIEDIDTPTLERICTELDSFFKQAQPILDQSDYTHDPACHDFYFTRCHHGVGFWENDHCTESQGEALTYIAQSFSEVNLSEENGQLYVE